MPKEERLHSKKLIEQLFSNTGSKALTAFPVRAVFLTIEREAQVMPPVMMMVSVSKRHFKHAVDRNRVKRQLREAYRKNKSELVDRMTAQHPGETLCVAFVWIDSRPAATSRVDYCMQQLLQRIGERL